MKKDLGLYLHIPWCVKKCGYWDFLLRRGEEEEREKQGIEEEAQENFL